MTGSSTGLLSYDGYSPAMRDLFPANLFRAELLKAIRYPEISYRKFCTEEYLGMDRKQNRVFCGLSLSKKDLIDHTQLSKFRTSLTFAQQLNLLVYILHHFNQTDLETVRVRSQPATMARCTLGSIAVLLIKMAGFRKKQSADRPQQVSLFKENKAA